MYKRLVAGKSFEEMLVEKHRYFRQTLETMSKQIILMERMIMMMHTIKVRVKACDHERQPVPRILTLPGNMSNSAGQQGVI